MSTLHLFAGRTVVIRLSCRLNDPRYILARNECYERVLNGKLHFIQKAHTNEFRREWGKYSA